MIAGHMLLSDVLVENSLLTVQNTITIGAFTENEDMICKIKTVAENKGKIKNAF